MAPSLSRNSHIQVGEVSETATLHGVSQCPLACYILLVHVLLFSLSALNFSRDSCQDLVSTVFVVGFLILVKGLTIKRIYQEWPIDLLETIMYVLQPGFFCCLHMVYFGIGREPDCCCIHLCHDNIYISFGCHCLPCCEVY